MNNKKFIIFLLGIFLFSFVSSAPPTQTNINSQTGLQIFYPQYEFVKLNQSFSFNIHVTNITTGKEINNSLVNCSLDLYNSTGSHILENGIFIKDPDGRDLFLVLSGGNFSKIGVNSFRIYCAIDGIGGEVFGTYKVTLTGLEFDLQKTILSLFVIIFLIFLSISSVYVANNKLPSGDTMNEEGTILSINFLKYLRPILWAFSWIMTIATIFLLFNLSNAYLDNNMLSNFLFVTYKILFYFTIIALPVYFIWLIAKFFQDREMQQMIERGVDIKSEYG